MPLTLEPEEGNDPIRAEEHDDEEAQHVALGDPEDPDDGPAGEEEDDEAE
jgi:hypothetical protein